MSSTSKFVFFRTNRIQKQRWPPLSLIGWGISTRALTPLFGTGARALGIGKNSGVSLKSGKKHDIFCYPYTCFLQLYIMYLTVHTIRVLLEIKYSVLDISPLFPIFVNESHWENLGSKLGKKDTILHWEWGLISAPNQADREPCQLLLFSRLLNGICRNLTFMKQVFNVIYQVSGVFFFVGGGDDRNSQKTNMYELLTLRHAVLVMNPQLCGSLQGFALFHIMWS